MASPGRYGSGRNYFEVAEIGYLRKMRFRRRPMSLMCARFEDTHTREQVVEAIDATIVGVDLLHQKRYPFGFLRADCLDLDVRFLRQFDLIHASPPCQFGSELTPDKSRHLNLIPATRHLLKRSGVPYVIENVRAVRPHMVNPVSLFGTMFGNSMTTSTGQQYVLSRERLFETSWDLTPAWNPGTGGLPIANIYGGHLRCRDKAHRTGNGTGRTRDFIGEDKPALARQLMEMPWGSMVGMSEAIPPSYSQFIGEQFIAQQRKAA